MTCLISEPSLPFLNNADHSAQEHMDSSNSMPYLPYFYSPTQTADEEVECREKKLPSQVVRLQQLPVVIPWVAIVEGVCKEIDKSPVD